MAEHVYVCHWCGRGSASGMRAFRRPGLFEGKFECIDADTCLRRSAGWVVPITDAAVQAVLDGLDEED